MLAGLPFGCGFVLIFMALLNCLTDAYEIFAASAMAAASCARSLAGAVLPFAATPLYGRAGDRIRAGSQFCTYLKEKKEREATRGREGPTDEVVEEKRYGAY
ncbi:hypothetical protein DL95DRAFT_478182 [Leptodontidium sp. 2 PMI_412]|nr:hypothetical protein DL95DRAFT_478182 [Leptodontidium sp. 2 PMI_412]